MEEKISYKALIAVFALGLIIGGIAGVYWIKAENTGSYGLSRATDTVTVIRTDTVRITAMPVVRERVKYVERTRIDTVYQDRPVFVKGEIQVPIKSYHFRQGQADVYASGYKVTLDSLFFKTPITTKTITKTIYNERPNTLYAALDVRTDFWGGHKTPGLGMEFGYRKGGMTTWASAGAVWDGRTYFRFATGWRWEILRRQF